MTSDRSPGIAQPDFTVVRKDGSTVVVEVKHSGGRRIKYGLPRETLNVVFTERGIVSDTEPDVEAERLDASGSEAKGRRQQLVRKLTAKRKRTSR